MDQGPLGRFTGSLHDYLLPRRHTALLVAIVSAFAARPMIGDLGVAPLAFSVALMVLMLLALYTIQVDELVGERQKLVAQRKRRGIIGWLLAIPAVTERIVIVVVPKPFLILTGSIFWLLFFAYVTWNELRAVLRQKEVTGETISMSISVYLLMGLTWGTFYIVLYYLQPHAFSFGSSSTLPSRTRSFSGARLLQSDDVIDYRVWRYNSDNPAIALRRGRRGYYGAVLSCDFGRAAGGDLYEPIGK